MKKPELKKDPIRASEIFRDLRRALPALQKLKQRGEAYNALIDIILALNEEESMPLGKELQQRLNLSPSRLKKMVDVLYEDFIDGIGEGAELLQFTNVEHQFYVKGYRDSAMVSCRLPVTPRVGDEVELPFIEARTGSRHYYVTEVKHSYENDKALVTLWVRPGTYNRHFHYLQDKAYYEHRLGWNMKFEFDFAIEKKLREIYP